MDDHTHALVLAADEKLSRLAMIIEQEQLHIAGLHPARRTPEVRKLKDLKCKYARLMNYRQALLREPCYRLLH